MEHMVRRFKIWLEWQTGLAYIICTETWCWRRVTKRPFATRCTRHS